MEGVTVQQLTLQSSEEALAQRIVETIPGRSQVVSLLAHGCPLQAAVATLGVDERTVAAWQAAAGVHCRSVHEAVVQQGQLDLQQAQTDEIRVKAQGAILWVALAIAVSTRLWLGGVVSQTRDTPMALALALHVKACALCRPLLVCFGGFVSYVKAFQQCLRTPLREGKRCTQFLRVISCGLDP